MVQFFDSICRIDYPLNLLRKIEESGKMLQVVPSTIYRVSGLIAPLLIEAVESGLGELVRWYSIDLFQIPDEFFLVFGCKVSQTIADLLNFAQLALGFRER